MDLSTANGLLRLLLMASASTSTVSSCGEPPKKSVIESVEIAQTDVRNQYRVGFCWAYATIGLLESKYKMETGKTLDLSEEALGFHRMAAELYADAKAVQAGNMTVGQALIPLQSSAGLQGWFVRSGNQYTPGAMELIDSYGVVPESAWSFKFRSDNDIVRLKQAVLPVYQNLLTQGGDVTMDDIEHVLATPGGFPSIPPKSFVFEGGTITALSHAQYVLKFHPSDYRELSANSVNDAPALLAATKRSLARGISVPLLYPADPSFVVNGMYTASSSSGMPNKNTGHAVLITDFVNVGGHEGAMSSDALKTELGKGFESLSYLKFKNSWGAIAQYNESGVPVQGSNAGYFNMDKSYIEDIASVGCYRVVVPSDIANDPFGEEPINNLVTSDK